MNPVTPKVVKAAIRIAADAPSRHWKNNGVASERTLIRWDLIDDLRKALDHSGYGDDWRLIQGLRERDTRQVGVGS